MGRGQGRGRSAGAQNDQNLSGDDLGPLGDTQVLAEQTPAPKRSRTAGNSPQQSVKKLNTGGGSAARGTSADSLGGESVPAQKRAPRGRHVYKCLKCKVQNNHNPQLVFISRVACEKCNGVYMDHLTQHGTWEEVCEKCDKGVDDLDKRWAECEKVRAGQNVDFYPHQVDAVDEENWKVSKYTMGMTKEQFLAHPKFGRGKYYPEDLGYKFQDCPKVGGGFFKGVIVCDPDKPFTYYERSTSVIVHMRESKMPEKKMAYAQQPQEVYDFVVRMKEAAKQVATKWRAKIRTCSLTDASVAEKIADLERTEENGKITAATPKPPPRESGLFQGEQDDEDQEDMDVEEVEEEDAMEETEEEDESCPQGTMTGPSLCAMSVAPTARSTRSKGLGGTAVSGAVKKVEETEEEKAERKMAACPVEQVLASSNMGNAVRWC